MLHDKTILVVGGDLRWCRLAALLALQNRVMTLGLEKADSPIERLQSMEDVRRSAACIDWAILPMPVCTEDLCIHAPFSAHVLSAAALLDCLDAHTHVLAGKIPPALAQRLQEKGMRYTDYAERESLAIQNAVPTAEGAVQIAMEETGRTIFGMKVCILGYGRLGKVLARTFSALGAEVTVCARKSADLAWIRSAGWRAVKYPMLETVLPDVQLLINTVPARVLDAALLQTLPSDALLIDLASLPGGTEESTAGSAGVRMIRALSLPGKVAPLSAGEILYDTLQEIAAEEEDAR